MAKLLYSLNQSLDGYVDHTAFAPGLALFHHFIDDMRLQTGILHGRGMYELMSYWDHDQPGWEPHEHAFAAAWRAQPKWVASRTLTSVGPNATLIQDDLETFVRQLKSNHPGEIEVAGPHLAATLSALNLIDEYRIYLHPVVLGRGVPYFTAPRPPLRLHATDRLADNIIRLTYTPA